jgi:hypothetical protein
MYVLLVHLAATLVMVGEIWLVQIVHYPLFCRVGSGGFALYSDAHSRLTTYIVGPPMLIEAATALFLVFRRPEDVPLPAALVELALVGVVWLSTALLQVSCHSPLGSGFDHTAWSGIVLTNWVRTVTWSARPARSVDDYPPHRLRLSLGLPSLKNSDPRFCGRSWSAIGYSSSVSSLSRRVVAKNKEQGDHHIA